MPATSQNITHYQGDNLTLTLGPVVDTDGNMVDLTAALSVRWWMAKKVTSTGTDIFVKKEVGDGITLSQISSHWFIVITLDPEDTESITPGAWYHECEVVDSSGRVATVTVGKFTIKDTLIPPAP